MSEQSKKKFLKWYNVLLIVLAVAFVAVSLTSVVVIDSRRAEYPELFYEARFTAGMTPTNEVKLGYGTLLGLITNWEDFITVITIQSNEGYVNNESKLLQELRDAEASEERIQELLDDIADTRKTLEEDLAELTEEDFDRIADKLENDDGFRNIVCAVYSFAGAADEEDETGDVIEETDGAFGINPMPILVSILNVVVIISFIGIALIYPIILIFKLIAQLIFFLRHVKDEDPSAVENRIERFPFSGYCGTFIMTVALFSLFAPEGMYIGTAIIGCIIIWLISNVLRAVKHILINENNKPLALAKQGITCISIVAAVVMLVNFCGIGLIGDLEDSISSISYNHYMAELEALEGENMSAEEMKDAAEGAVTLSNGINAGVVVIVTMLGIMLIAATMMNAAERMGYKLMKLRTGERMPYKAMYGMAIVLLVFVLIPVVLFTANSEEALEDAYAAGNFKVWYTAYEEEGTPENLEYELLKETREAMEEAVEDLKGDELEEAQAVLAGVEAEIDEIESKGSRGITCVVAAVILLLAELLYRFLPKFFPAGKKEEPVAEVKETEETFESAPVEPAPVEPAPEEPAPEEPVPEEPAPEEPASAAE